MCRNRLLKKISQPVVIAGVLFCLVTVLGHATIIKTLSFEELIENADLILAGTCEKTETVWLDKKIYTIATIRVSQSAKGKAIKGDTIDVYILGGRVKEPIPVKMHVPGAAKIAKGEEVVLFLESRGDRKQYHRLVGMAQGKIPVSTDAKTGEKFVHYAEPIKGVKWVDQNGKPIAPTKARARAEPAKEGSLEGFLGGIQQIVAEQEAAAKALLNQKTRPDDAHKGEEGGVK